MKRILFPILSLCLCGLSTQVSAQVAKTEQVVQAKQFQLVALPYSTDALAPVISKQTIELHHGKHLQGYVNQANKLKQGTEWANKTLEEIVKTSSGALFNNAGQLYNHNLYFTQFSPKPKQREPQGRLLTLIEARWGSYAKFKEAFEVAGASFFGSGWVWFSIAPNGELGISLHQGGDSPLTAGKTPLLGIDLWEHAYYLDYQNRRIDHLKAVWDIIDWSVISERLGER